MAIIRDCVIGGWGRLLFIFGQFLVNVTRQTLVLPFSISLLPFCSGSIIVAVELLASKQYYSC